MPLHRQLSPFPFGSLVGGLFGLLLTPDRFQVIFRRQLEFGGALIGWHSATPKKTRAYKVFRLGPRTDTVTAQLTALCCRPLFRFAQLQGVFVNTPSAPFQF
jgi:hypothetical protein